MLKAKTGGKTNFAVCIPESTGRKLLAQKSDCVTVK